MGSRNVVRYRLTGVVLAFLMLVSVTFGVSSPPRADATVVVPGVLETGAISATDAWQTITLAGSFTDPVVVAGGPAHADTEPVAVRVRNVSATAFEVRLEEFEYQDGTHGAETVSYLVVERGTHVLPSGATVAADSSTVGSSYATVSLPAGFTVAPLVFAAPTSVNEPETVVTRVRNVGTGSFQVKLQEQETTKATHGSETVSWVAWDVGFDDGTTDQVAWESGSINTTHAFGSVALSGAYNEVCVLAGMTTTNGGDSANVRIDNLSTSGFAVNVDEETSKDTEVNHTTETIGWLATECATPAGNQPPVASNVSISGVAGTSIPWTPDVFDPNSDAMTCVVVSASGVPTDAELDAAVQGDCSAGSFDASGVTPGTYSFDYEVTDTEFTDSATVSVQVTAPFQAEAGFVSIDEQWTTVQLVKPFHDPVVVAGGAGHDDVEPVTVRLKNVTPTSFEIGLQRYEYQTTPHLAEDVSYLVVERGHHTMPSGTAIEANSASVGSTYATVSFDEAFPSAPVVMSSVSSVLEPEAAVTRVNAVGTGSFQVKLQEQESTKATHGTETVSWVAIDTGSDDGSLDPFAWESGAVVADENFASVTVAGNYAEACVVAGMNTNAGNDTANVRIANRTASSFQVNVDEEQSANAEVGHVDETIGYIVADCLPPLPAVDPTLTVDLDPALITTVAGDGTSAVVDGDGTAASFADPKAVTVAGAGAIVADGHGLRMVERGGDFAVSTWVGDPSVPGCVDSTDPSAVRFTDIQFVATDQTSVFVADSCAGLSGHHSIRKVDLATGATTSVRDGAGDLVTLYSTVGFVVAPDGYIYVTRQPATVDRIDPTTGIVTPVRSKGDIYEFGIGALAVDSSYIYLVLNLAGVLRLERIDLADYSSRDFLIDPLGDDPSELIIAGDYLYGTDPSRDVLKRWSIADGSVTTVAGSGASGYADGVENEAWFGEISGLATDGSQLWIVDANNYRIRTASTVTPLPRAIADSVGSDVSFKGSIVVTIAGNGADATVDGTGSEASFQNLRDVVVIDGFAYVAQQTVIRKVNLDTGDVTTLAGQAGVVGEDNSTDPALVTFNINRMVTDGYWLYTDNGNGGTLDISNRIRRTSTVTGATSTVGTFKDADGFVIGPDAALYHVSGYRDGGNVRRIDTVSGDSAILPGSNAGGHPVGVAADEDMLWISTKGVGLTSAPENFSRYNLDTNSLTICSTTPRGYAGLIQSAGSDVLGRSGGDVVAIDKTACPGGDLDAATRTIVAGATARSVDPVTPGLDLVSIAGFDWDGEAIYVVDSGTNRLRVIVDAFNPPGGFAMGYDGYGTWRHGVNAGLGNFVWSDTDQAVATIGPELAVTRTYNSSDPRVGPFGFGWTFNYDMRWENDGGGNIVVLYPDGRRETHVPNGSGGWLAPIGYFSTLSGNETSGFTLTMKDDTVYSFNSDGALTSIVDPNGNELELTYDADHLQQVKALVSDRSLFFTWDGDFISEVETDPVAANGNLPYVWKYYYSDNELTESCDPRDNSQTGVCHEYVYTNGRITEIRKPEGNIDARIGYYPSGEVQWRQDGEGFANGYQTSFAKPDTDTVVITDGNGNISTQIFDDKYRLLEEQVVVDTVTYTTSYTYDDDGNRKTVTDANNNTATMEYDDRGNMISVENAEGEISYFEYDADDNLIASRDARSVNKDDDTYKTSFTYDSLGNKLTETDALGNTQAWEYTDGTESAADVGLVPSGLLNVYREQRGNIDLQNPDGAYNTVYGYYHTGDLAAVVTPSGFRTDYTYDELGRLLTEAITDPDAGITSQIVATYTYDEAGNVKTVTGPVMADALTGLSHQLRTTNTFDDNSNLLTVEEADLGGVDPSRTTGMEYDENDREFRVIDPELATIEREYDNVGNVIKVTDQNGTVTETVYDTRNLATDVFVRNFDDGHGNPAYDVHLSAITYDAAGRKLTETDAEGRVTEWTYDDADRVLTVTRLGFVDHSTVTRDVLLSETTYDAAGNVETQTTGDGVANQALVTNTYDAAGRLDTSTLEMGTDDRVTDFDYDAAGNVEEVTRSQGIETEVTTSQYDVAGRLVKTVVDPAGENLTTYFEYDARGNQTKSRDGRSADEFDNTYLTTTRYDVLSRPVEVESPVVEVSEYGTPPTTQNPTSRIGYDTYGSQTAVEDANGNVTHYEFDLLGRVVEVAHPTNEASPLMAFDGDMDEASWVKTGPAPSQAYKATDGSLSTYWDLGSGAQSAVFDIGELAGLESISYWQYYNDGRTYHDSQVDVSLDGHHWTTVFGPAEVAFDSSGQTITLSPELAARYIRISSNGSTSNSSNHIVEVEAIACSDCPVEVYAYESFSYDPVGNLKTEISRRGQTTAYTYDDLNRVVRQTDPQVTGETAAGYTQMFYNNAGELVATVDAEGGRTETGYDQLGRVNEERVIVSQDPQPNAYSWIYDYDDLGNRTYVQEPSGAETTSVYTAASELERVTDDLGEFSTFEYDLAGRKIQETDRDQLVTNWFYDDAGRLEYTEQPASDGGPVATTVYEFDAVGNMTEVTSPRGNATVYDYDALSRLESVTAPVVGLQTITTAYGYDAVGNNTVVVDGRGEEFWTTHNAWNLPEDVIEPETTAHPTAAERTWSTSYDPGGLPITETQPGGVTVTRVFDELGRMESETGVGGAEDTYRSFEYDLVGRPTMVSHPSGGITYGYDDRGLLVSTTGPAGTATFEYDGNGRLIERVDAAGTHTFEWTSRNELDRYLDPLTGEWIDYVWTDSSKPDLVTYGTSGLVRDYDYDTAGFLETDVLTNGATTVSAYDYLYDDDGNLAQKSVTLPGNAMSGVHDYSYDDGGRLKTWDAPGQSVVTYVWDDSGNRTAAGTDTWTYDERNRLKTGPDGSYTYDARGTVSQIGAETYGFDASGRLVDFNGEVEYSYDGLDRVSSRLADSTLDVFTYAGMGLDPVADGTFTYSRTPAGRVMAQTDGTVVRWAGLDKHGDLTGLLDPVTGTMTDTVVFDPFGDAVSSTGTTGQTLGFQGDYTDPASGEVWMGARWYNGGDAAFRSRDTVFGQLSTPISLNRYTYGWASPLKYWDPDGRAPVTDGAGAAITGFEDDGTPVRAAPDLGRYERYTEQVDEARRAHAIESYYQALYETSNPYPQTATEAIWAAWSNWTLDGWNGVTWSDGQKFIMFQGNPARASNVVVYVPGTSTDAGNIEGMASGRGSNLMAAVRELYGADAAVVIMLPYDAYNTVPENAFECMRGYCEESGSAIADVLSLFDPNQNVMVIAHSLGSSLTGHAFRDHPYLSDHVDNLTLVGSPGVPQARAREFGVDVVVGIAPDDGISHARNAWSEGPSLTTRAGCAVLGGAQALAGLFGDRSSQMRTPDPKRGRACESPPKPWDSEFGADVYWAPDLAYPRWDGPSAHGVYLDDEAVAQDLVYRGLTGEWDELRRGARLGYEQP